MLNLGTEKKYFHIPCVEIKKENDEEISALFKFFLLLFCVRGVVYGIHLLLMFNLAKLIKPKRIYENVGVIYLVKKSWN